MKIEKAIEELDGMLDYRRMTTTEKQWKALKLGIEALKRVQNWRRGVSGIAELLLPGETEE